MEQVWLTVTGKFDLIIMGCFLLIIILLAVTLHKIRKSEKQTKKLAEVAECTLLQVEHLTELNQAETAEGETAWKVDKTIMQPKEERPEELLNAVLGEVFS